MARTFGLDFSGDLRKNTNGAEHQQHERDTLHFDLTLDVDLGRDNCDAGVTENLPCLPSLTSLALFF